MTGAALERSEHQTGAAERVASEVRNWKIQGRKPPSSHGRTQDAQPRMVSRISGSSNALGHGAATARISPKRRRPLPRKEGVSSAGWRCP